MEKKDSPKTESDYSPLNSEDGLDQTKSKEQQQENRLSADLDDKRPAGDAGPEDTPKTKADREYPPY
jgi:hypothetical protein